MHKTFLLFLAFLSFSTISVGQNIATISGNSVTIDNGSIESFISGGRMISLNTKSGQNLLNNGGYGYFSYNDNNGFYSPSSVSPQVVINNEDIVDLFFEHRNNFTVEMHYVFKKEESGFYTYFVIRDNDLASKVMSEVRWAVRLDKDIFDYAWTVEREGAMIHPDVLDNAVDEIQDATYLLSDGSIYSKYDWSVYRNVDSLHGILGNGYGVWNIEASSEYVNGGPTMQDLTLHGTTTTPILLTSFQTSHYGNVGVALKNEYLDWGKIYGPAFTYVNTGTNSELIEDAKREAASQKAQWPYEWLSNELYPLERGTVRGTLNMQGHGMVDSAMVVLSKPTATWHIGPRRDWQKQPYDYIFFTEADQNGNFSIENVRPGNYTLYAYPQKGKLIQDLEIETIEVTVGETDLGTVTWEAEDKDRILFQVGQADHKSSEFGLANLPRLYGRWQETPDNLTYTIGASSDRADWFYCQRENTLWDVTFDVNALDSIFEPVLKVALAGSDAGPNLDVLVNGEKVGFQRAGSDSGIRRSSLSGGKYVLYSFPFDKSLLVEGTNTITLNCYGSASEYKGLMYDAILLEANVEMTSANRNLKKDESTYRAFGNQKNVIIHSGATTQSDLKIYSMGTGQLLYSGRIDPGPNTVKLDKTGSFLISISSNTHLFQKKIMLF